MVFARYRQTPPSVSGRRRHDLLVAVRLSGRDDVELHFERFAAPPVLDGEPFVVSIATTRAEIRVGAEETLLVALRRSGVSAPYSCQQGFCGTCRTRVLSGGVDHRDTLLTDPERAAGMMLVCISRAAHCAFGSGIPSLALNSASLCVDNPIDTTVRGKNTSVT